MPMPEGIVTARINRRTGCPADANTNFEDVMFESFRTGNVPECQVGDTLTDPFNIDNEPGPGQMPVPREEEKDDDEQEEETLF